MKLTGGFFVLILLLACSSKKTQPVDLAYLQEIEQWHDQRVESLKGPSGWLNIAGLFWLKPGINSFGSGKDNDFVYPSVFAAEHAGYFLLENDKVKQIVSGEVVISSSGLPVKEMIVYHPDSTRQPVLESGPLQWFVIKRDTRYGVRLRDSKNPALESFTGVERFPVDPTWRVIAHWEKTEGRTIPITNILGQTTDQPSPGALMFTLNGKKFRLDALDEGGDELFMIFGDATNTKETYGAGRYLYVPKPDSLNQVIVDFNKAQNPPCAFTEFATCPLPPIQNVMDVEIRAGEKDYHLR